MSYRFDPYAVRDELVENIREYARMEGFAKVVLGISGGKDSTVTAALCARALGSENVYGIMIPDGIQKDIKDSELVCKSLGIRSTTVNIQEVHQTITNMLYFANKFFTNGWEIPVSKEADINVAPRLRMTVLRYIAQSLGARLAGTGNLSEITVGYCTKDGDTSCDFSVLGGLTSVEVVQVGLTMDEIPKDLVIKTPTDGLSGMSDEEKLGISYEDIHHFIRSDAAIRQDVVEKIINKFVANMHKQTRPPLMWQIE